MTQNIKYPHGGFPKLIYIDDLKEQTLVKKREFNNKNIISIKNILDDRRNDPFLFLSRQKPTIKKEEKKKIQIDDEIDTNDFKKDINLSDINQSVKELISKIKKKNSRSRTKKSKITKKSKRTKKSKTKRSKKKTYFS